MLRVLSMITFGEGTTILLQVLIIVMLFRLSRSK